LTGNRTRGQTGQETCLTRQQKADKQKCKFRAGLVYKITELQLKASQYRGSQKMQNVLETKLGDLKIKAKDI
jgi:hypothetical protein